MKKENSSGKKTHAISGIISFFKGKFAPLAGGLLAGIVIATVLFQFSCSREPGEASLFGNSTSSPLREKHTQTEAHRLQETFREIFELYRNRVVFITTEQVVKIPPHPFFDDPFMREFFGGRSRVQKRRGLGTGFILSEDGYICTNHHVVNGVDTVYVRINKDDYRARVIGTDPNTDIALLKINVNQKLEPVFFGDSDTVTVGDWAIAIGNPFGLDRTFTVGVVSAIRKDVDMVGNSHIQTDASINPGNSGGPLINIYGEVIGINRMIYSKSGGYMGIGFAIPVNTSRSILAQLKKHGHVERGFIGVSIVPMTEDYARQLGLDSVRGAFIGDVLKGSPADKGGIRVGDVILEIDGKKIEDYRDLIRIVGQADVGERLKVAVWREGKRKNLTVVVGERPGNS